MPNIDPESPEGQLLANIICQRLSSFDLDLSAEDVAKYVVMMICNGKSAGSITEELNGMLGSNFEEIFGEWAIQIADQISSGQISGMDDVSTRSREPSVSFDVDPPTNGGSLSSRIDKKTDRNIGKITGISKRTNKLASRLGKNFGSDSNRSMALMSEMQSDQNMENGETRSGEVRVNVHNRQRCRHWPNCNLRGCRFGHPAALCRFGPHCQMAQGTCPYLHEEDMAKGFIPRSMMPFPAVVPTIQTTNFRGMANAGALQAQIQPPVAIQVCKYKDKCVNKDCPFGHVTPANTNLTITDFTWCAARQECEDPNCPKLHPSSSLVREPEPIETPNYLDACKFGSRCTNSRCKYRHATSTVVCRNGQECTRPDCSFSHPLAEACKFGNNCTNKFCLYQHDAERDSILANGGPRMTWKRETPQPIEGGA